MIPVGRTGISVPLQYTSERYDCSRETSGQQQPSPNDDQCQI